MKIKHLIYTDVPPDGRVRAGLLEVAGSVRQSTPEGGCGSPDCNCGHWVSILLPRTEDGVVFGYTADFDSREDLEATDLDTIRLEAQKLLH